MSDTSIVSRAWSYDKKHRKIRNSNDHSSFCNRYWFCITATLLLLVIVIILGILGYVLYKQGRRDRERRRIQGEFKQKHGLANKALDLITKDGIVAKWLKKNKSTLVTTFRQMMTEMIETIFGQ